MTNKFDPNFSRVKRRNKADREKRFLNIAIGVVAALILIVAGFILLGGNENDHEDVASDKPEEQLNENQNNIGDDGSSESSTDETTDAEESDEGTSNNSEGNGSDSHDDESDVISTPSDDEVVNETIVNPSWRPIGTVQTGEHVSVYELNHVDWKEKVDALAYATGLDADTMIVWKIKNGGSPQKSIGIVSSRDKSEMYRVYIDWIDSEGWKPVKMDVLNTLDFEY